MERLQAQCLKRGAAGIKALGRTFRIWDDDGNHALSYGEFKKGLMDYGLEFTEDEFAEMVQLFDKNQDGSIVFDEFLARLQPPMNATRIKLVNQAFDKLDKDQSGIVTIDDLRGIFNPKHHRKYQSGEWTEDQVFAEYLRSFDSPNEPDCQVTRDEFIAYYSGVSVSIDNDSYFDLMMRHSWKL